MKASATFLSAAFAALLLSACCKDEPVLPEGADANEAKLLIVADDDATANPVDIRPDVPQGLLRNGDDPGDEGQDDGSGTGISDDGDDDSDSEKSNRKGR